ncbi:hypothetical protein [Maribacter flavus]|uniref:Uncharacterized protein n=1 Tax=Maribacter flavus TaxID=1658664 RepID=A0A5B2TXC1_9FLAO|nr:hypothetical protein [Maribacter flavus]KAA2218813.1 hypothetical protein F0361_04085 [Maribacter flavus]
MKKIAVIFVIVGLCLVGLAYYFSSESLKLIERKHKGDDLNDVILGNEMILEVSAKEELQYDNEIIYPSIALNKPDHAAVSPCIQLFQSNGELDALCLNNLLNVVIDDFGELAFFKADIGSSIDYDNLSFDHTFLSNLFSKNNTLANSLTLGFLNRYRNPERLQQAFRKHKQDLFQSVPKNMYQRVFEKQVNRLLSAHEEIAQQNNKEAFFEDLYFKADTQNSHRQYWKYTFWKRREIEKTDGIVFTILSEIKKRYDR